MKLERSLAYSPVFQVKIFFLDPQEEILHLPGLTVRRLDSDFLGFGINHAAGYARVDLGAWYAINSRVTAYANVENALNRHYEEVVGFPALHANFRAGMRFRIGGE